MLPEISTVEHNYGGIVGMESTYIGNKSKIFSEKKNFYSRYIRLTFTGTNLHLDLLGPTNHCSFNSQTFFWKKVHKPT